MKHYSLLALLALASVQGFAPSLPTIAFSRSTVTDNAWQLNGIIRSDAADFKFDQGQGGVRLAEESAIKLLGTVQHGPGKATPELEDLIRYTKVTEVEDSVVKSVMGKVGLTLITTGIGKEVFKDPGATTNKEVTLAPPDAVRDALMGAGSVSEAKKLVINFLGGDDLMSDQVRDAVAKLVLDLSPPTKAKISYNSLCHQSFPLESCTVTVLAKNGEFEEGAGGLNDVEKSIANGDVYFRDGKWWTVVEGDINTDIA